MKRPRLASIAAWDANDGLADGQIRNPRMCSFDPSPLRSTAGDTPACLTGAQHAAAKGVCARSRSSTGLWRYAGAQPGSEGGWDHLFAGNGGYGRFVGHYVWGITSPPYDDWRRELNWDDKYHRLFMLPEVGHGSGGTGLGPDAVGGGFTEPAKAQRVPESHAVSALRRWVGFLPPVPLPRRMWAGSRLEFVAPLRVGQRIARTSRIDDVLLKEGRTGPLVFVKVQHEITGDDRLAIHEAHDIVYREMPAPGEPAPAGVAAPAHAQFTRRIVPDDVLLFRYSALTFNGHRIHYDRRYVTEVEGYPGLIVHGPLIATLLLDLLRRQRADARVAHFTFKAMKPIFDIAPFDVCGRFEDDQNARLWARTPEGHLAMEATATLA